MVYILKADVTTIKSNSNSPKGSFTNHRNNFIRKETKSHSVEVVGAFIVNHGFKVNVNHEISQELTRSLVITTWKNY